MKQSFYFYKVLTAAEVGDTGTHEVYVRLTNDFDYESFFGNTAVTNGSVMECNFTAQDITNGRNESIPLRFVYYFTSNKEKRIPSLGALFNHHNVKKGDVVSLESRQDGKNISYYICFYKKGEIEVNPSAIYFSRIESEFNDLAIDFNPELDSLQKIFYGAPGTGKSHKIKDEVDKKGKPCIRTTFHPDSDYSTFVGAYKPTTVNVPVMTIIGKEQVPVVNAKPEKKIVYKFVPQAFLKAYTAAWKNQEKPFYLVIEEINRGNCAQIFGDLFQLLDRNDKGYSDYEISPDEDIQLFLQTDEKFGFAALTDEQKEAIPENILTGEIMKLPNNLHIWATMNTSDQSLFPIDSAFKRRWDWEYLPIYDAEKGWNIEVNNKLYGWWNFLELMNDKIGSTTNSEDKKLGYFFCKPQDGIIDAKTFVGKVIFYIWNDVFKDFAEEAGDLFKDVDGKLLSFDKFYVVGTDGQTVVNESKVELFLQHLGVLPISELEPEVEDEDGNSVSDSTGSKDYSKYSVNGEGRYGKNRLAVACMRKYIGMNPNMPVETVLQNWKSLGNIVPHFVESKEEYDARTDNCKNRSEEIECNDTVLYVAHDGYGNNGKVNILIDAVNKKNWGITLAKI